MLGREEGSLRWVRCMVLLVGGSGGSWIVWVGVVFDGKCRRPRLPLLWKRRVRTENEKEAGEEKLK